MITITGAIALYAFVSLFISWAYCGVQAAMDLETFLGVIIAWPIMLIITTVRGTWRAIKESFCEF
jgi:hypothetical protein